MSKIYTIALLLFLPLFAVAQIPDITSVTLTFTPGSGSAITATATDSGGGLVADGPINLDESTDYDLTITLGGVGGTDITSLAAAAADGIQFFFVSDEETFTDEVSYDDTDSNGLPIGLSTDWTTECTEDGDISSTFRVALNALIGIKSENSTINDGTSLFDVTWDVNVADDPDAPECENEEEEIDKVTLTFTPVGGGTPVVAIAEDPDGPGPLSIVPEEITLMESTEYELSIMLENTIEGEDITEEIEEEDEDHIFLFSFGEDVFEDPDGNGNFDERTDPINYNDQDENGLDVGLSTQWTTACTEDGNVVDTFRVILKHQPGLKTATSGFDVGGTDINILWDINIIDNPDAPECENEEEEIDKVTLTFTPVGGGTPVVAIAEDPDGPGPLSIVPEEINLMESTEYELSIMLENTIEGEDITEEIEEEDEDHIFLFAFGEDVFDTPNGNGNVDERTDPINYNDQDENGLDVGLSTQWTTSCTQDGDIIDTFRVVLKHQPGLKTATSGFDVGGTDINILWDINIIDNPDAPECENEEEEIDKVTLIFSPADGSFPTISEAIDPDGPGPLSIQPLPITLMQNTTYNLSIELENTIEGEDITEEIEEEAEEHQFFFQFTDNIFSDPIEDGNFDDRDDPINYVDFDDNNLPVGLSTTWTTSNASEVGTLRIRLKHQPGIKSDMSTADDGGTDIDLTWDISLVVTSTDNLAANQKVTIAPNPVKDNLILVTENIDLSDAEIMIFNSLGQLMKSVVYTNPSIRISELPSGSYAFIAKKGNLTVTRRFVKMQ